MRKVLVVHYSQTGNLRKIAENFMKPWQKGDIYQIDFVGLTPKPEFKFPWTWKRMFNVFPECALQQPCELEALDIPDTDQYELVVLALQTWFLFPSIPMGSFAQSQQFRDLVKNRKVLILIQCRNSWRNTIRIIEDRIKEARGSVVSEYIFSDKANNLIGAVSILFWLMKGKKKMPLLPEAGVSLADVNNAYDYGALALDNYELQSNEINAFRTIIPEDYPKFVTEGYEEYVVNTYKKWASYITENNNKHRRRRVFIFQLWLIFGIIFLAPVVSLKSRLKK